MKIVLRTVKQYSTVGMLSGIYLQCSTDIAKLSLELQKAYAAGGSAPTRSRIKVDVIVRFVP